MTTLSDNPYALPVYDDWSAEQSAKREADYAAQLASFTDEQIARNIRELEQGEKDHAYTLMRSRDQARRDREFLWRYRREQERRAAEKLDTALSAMRAEHDEGRIGDTPISVEAPINLLDAVRAAGLRPNVPVTLNVVADLVCAAVCASTSLDAEREDGHPAMEAAE